MSADSAAAGQLLAQAGHSWSALCAIVDLPARAARAAPPVERLVTDRREILGGLPATSVAIAAHITHVRELLSRLLVVFVHRGAMPEGARLDDVLLWSSRSRGAQA